MTFDQYVSLTIVRRVQVHLSVGEIIRRENETQPSRQEE